MMSQNYPRPSRVIDYKACVKNIPLDMTNESLQALFGGCGTVIHSKVLPPKEGRNSTIGFVGFATEEELGYAVETMNGSSLSGCCLVVEKARERNQVTPGRDQESDYHRKQDFGYHNEQSFGRSMNQAAPSQGYRRGQIEQPVFAANGPGRGRGLGYQYLAQTALSNGASFDNGEIGVKREQPVFNPAGPGRGGVGVSMYQQSPTPPGRGDMVMNGTAGSHVENGDTTPYNYGRHDPYQSMENNRSRQEFYNGELPHWSQSADVPKDALLTGRLPHDAAPASQQMYATPDQSMHNERGGSGCFRCGEAGHFARECSTQRGKGFDNSCHHCGGEGHFARECPEAASSPDKGSPRRVAPVSYIPPELPSDVDELFRDMPHSGLNFDNYDNIPVQVTGREPVPPIASFTQAELLEQCSINIKRAQFTKPTPIQKYAIPIALNGRDLMACAQTGSGKTVAYLLPVLTNMIKQGHLSGGFLSGDTQAPAALCLAPTRELAMQIYKEVCKFSDGTVMMAAVCYGGVSVQYQSTKLRRGCHFLIATPGRLEDFVSRNRVSLENVRYLILDEADRMLDMGFEPAVRKLVERCGMPGKSDRQTLMFSATFPDEIQKLAADFLKEDYLFVAVGRVGGSNLDICQSIIPTSANEKQEKLFEILLNSGSDRTLIFVELKRVADFLACLLSGNEFPTTSISGDRTQQEREAALRDFRSGLAPVLVATSVAARGLDIPDVKHVINFDLPQDIEEYVHRIGRTGRIGNKGRATSFFQRGKDERLARSLVKVLSEAYQEVPEWLEEVAEEAIGSSYGPTGGKFSSRDRRERDHSRSGASTGPVASVTKGMERLNMKSQHNGGPPQFTPMATQNDDNEEEWD